MQMKISDINLAICIWPNNCTNNLYLDEFGTAQIKNPEGKFYLVTGPIMNLDYEIAIFHL